jgi:hypothetical protein
VGDTHIGKRKLKVGPKKDKGKKTKEMDEAVLGSDESTQSLEEGRSPPYAESNFSTSASSDDDDRGGGYRIEPSQRPIQFTCKKYQQIYLYSFHIIFLTSLTHALHFSGDHITLLPLRTRNMVHHILRGRPLRTRTYIWAEEGEEEDNIIFPRWTAPLLKI